MNRQMIMLGAALLAGAALFTSCDDEENNGTEVPVETLAGIYTINNGNMSGMIPGSITAYNYATGTAGDALQDAFAAKNGISIGDTPQSAIIYGDKMYIAVYNSNLIWVVNPQTLEIISSIRPEGEAVSPRYFAAKDGKVYASMFSGYIARIDTVSLKIDKTVKVGPNPEQMAVVGNKLYAANSDGMNWQNNYVDSYISVVDLASFTETKKIQDLETVFNPTDMATNGTDLFVLCKGNYGNTPSTVKKITGDDVSGVKEVCEGTMFAVNGNRLYVVNAPYFYQDPEHPEITKPEDTYKVYDTTSGVEIGNMLTGNRPDSPSAIGVDPVSGDIVILSYTVNASGNAQYRLPGYANIYSSDGVFKNKFECGVGAINMVFLHSAR